MLPIFDPRNCEKKPFWSFSQKEKKKNTHFIVVLHNRLLHACAREKRDEETRLKGRNQQNQQNIQYST